MWLETWPQWDALMDVTQVVPQTVTHKASLDQVAQNTPAGQDRYLLKGFTMQGISVQRLDSGEELVSGDQ